MGKGRDGFRGKSGAEYSADTQFLQVAHYDGGYNAEHQVVRWFWEVVHAMSGRF